MNAYFKDKQSHFVIANTATSEKMGLSTREELIGNCDHTFFTAEHADKSRSDEIQIMETQEKLDGWIDSLGLADPKRSAIIDAVDELDYEAAIAELESI